MAIATLKVYYQKENSTIFLMCRELLLYLQLKYHSDNKPWV